MAEPTNREMIEPRTLYGIIVLFYRNTKTSLINATENNLCKMIAAEIVMAEII